jgi:hypothetical protein
MRDPFGLDAFNLDDGGFEEDGEITGYFDLPAIQEFFKTAGDLLDAAVNGLYGSGLGGALFGAGNALVAGDFLGAAAAVGPELVGVKLGDLADAGRAAGKAGRAGGRAGRAAGGLPEVVFDYNTHPELADNIWHAIKAGHPRTLTRSANTGVNRAAALDEIPRIRPGVLSRDEYPFNSTAEGGAGAWVGHIPVAQQNSQGAILKNFYDRYGIGAGGRFSVNVINHPGGAL